MCRAVTCNKCSRPSWAGCGAHVEQVLGHVPSAQRCKCREATGPSEARPGLGNSIKRLFGLE